MEPPRLQSLVLRAGAKSIHVVIAQIHRHRLTSGQRDAMAQPPVSCAEVEDGERARESAPYRHHHTAHERVEGAGADRPLLRVRPSIQVGQRQQLGAAVSASLRGAMRTVLRAERRLARQRRGCHRVTPNDGTSVRSNSYST